MTSHPRSGNCPGVYFSVVVGTSRLHKFPRSFRLFGPQCISNTRQNDVTKRSSETLCLQAPFPGSMSDKKDLTFEWAALRSTRGPANCTKTRAVLLSLDRDSIS